tara:strand:+ start:4842 stop:5030 length:189 start_codon:yes stop_codon:yes gene_type:complete
MESSKIFLLIELLFFIAIFFIIVLSYVEGRIKKKQNAELERNMNKHVTRTGGLENDRLNERP